MPQNVLPVGLLLSVVWKPTGHFWAEDGTCMAWLNEQTANSPIYVALRSLTYLNKASFKSLHLGLSSLEKHFLGREAGPN